MNLRSFRLGMPIWIGLVIRAGNGQAADVPNVAIVVAPPVLLREPANQTADYGDNVTFTVMAEGATRYQWRKDGRDLADYDNVVGAHTAQLQLIGVALRDAGDYSVVVANAAGAVTSAVARLQLNPVTVFRDDFESGTLANWTAFSQLPGLAAALQQDAVSQKLAPITRAALSPEAIPLAISTERNRTPGGTRSAYLTSSRAKMYRNLGVELAGPVRATFWIYDDGGEQHRVYGELRGYTGAGHGLYVAPGGMKQLFAIGRYTVSFGPNNGTGLLAGEKVNPKKYQGKVERGKHTGWFNLDGAPDRSPGWHQFTIERAADGTTIHFYVDGVLGRTIPDADHVLIDCVTIGSAGMGTGVGEAWFDDVQVEAWPWRYPWQSKDSEGKGLPDWVRAREIGDDPRVTAVRQINTVSQQDGIGYRRLVGRWAKDGTGIFSLDLRGRVEYELLAPGPDAYRIEIEGRERHGHLPVAPLPLNVWLDGEYLGRFLLPNHGPTNTVVHCLTPFLTAGPHTVAIEWDNAAPRRALYLHAVRLQALEADDLDRDGIKDWVALRVQSQCGLELAPPVSRTSPVCIEGRSSFLSRIRLRAGPSPEEMKPVPVEPGAGHRWYANVPLSPDRPTRVELSYQNGVLEESTEIAWEPTNLLDTPDLTLRKGDALRLTAVPKGETRGEVKISIVGGPTYVTDALSPVVHRFEQAGNFTVLGTFSGRLKVSRPITVKVVEASLDSPVAAWVGKRRYWNCTNLPPEVVLEADPRLHLAEFPLPATFGPNARQIALTNDAAEPRVVLARLGKHGPVLARAVVEGFRLFNCYDTYLRMTDIYPDGSQLIEEAFILSPVLPQVTVQVRIIVSGVTFDDGTLTKTLTASDFDDLGICRVRYLRAPGVQSSVCHTTKAFQGETLIGWPAYEK